MMTELFTYLAYAGISLAAFYSVYYLFLRKSTLFRFNRAYLLATFILSFLLPAVNIPGLSTQPEPITSPDAAINLPLVINSIPEPATTHTWIDTVREGAPVAAGWLYLIGLVYILSKLAIALARIRKLRKTATPERLTNGVTAYRSAEVTKPASFLHTVFLPENLSDPTAIEAILRHEQAHVRQLHTIDVLLIEVGLALQWFNPAAWAYKYSMREVHEYLADEASINEDTEPAVARRHYQKALVAFCSGANRYSLTHTFSQPTLKNRIMMMNKKRNSSKIALRALIALPVCLGLLWLWADKADAQVTIKPASSVEATDDRIYVVNGLVVPTADHIDPDDILTVDVTGDPETVSLYGGTEGQKVIKIVLKDGTEEHLTAEEKEKIKVAISVTEGTPEELAKKFESVKIVKTESNYPPPLYIIDGEEVENFRMVNPDNIASMDVLKGEEATEKYGDKGKNGVVEIKLHKEKTSEDINENRKLPEPDPLPGQFWELKPEKENPKEGC